MILISQLNDTPFCAMVFNILLHGFIGDETTYYSVVASCTAIVVYLHFQILLISRSHHTYLWMEI